MVLRIQVFVNTVVAAGLTALTLSASALAATSTAVTNSSSARVNKLSSADEAFLAAQAAFRAGQRDRVAALAPQLVRHPLYPYLEFWQLQPRLRSEEPQRVDEAVTTFFAKYPDSYLADRLRMEWLLALGLRRDFAQFEREVGKLIWQHDDQQVRCFTLLAKYQRLRSDSAQADELAKQASNLLQATREAGGDGCLALTDALLQDGRLNAWDRVRALVEQNQLATARRIAGQIPKFDVAQLVQVVDRPAAWLNLHARRLTETQRQLAIIAISRLARDDVQQAERFASLLNLHFNAEQRGLVWGRIGHMAAVKLMPEALEWYRRGGESVGVGATARADEVLEWQARAALRGSARTLQTDWLMLRSTIERMPAELQNDPTWVYWRARALRADNRPEEATALLRSIAGKPHFYGLLATEDLGETITLPPRPLPPAPELIASFEQNAGLERALKLLDLGLRPDASREWGWQLRNRSDRELLAIGEFARRRGALDRMIHTAERTREEIDFEQRFPSPHRDELVRQAQAAGIDENWVYGLIRQESRFIRDARSSVGAQGLMQIMPTTARYVAKRVGMNDFTPARVTELEVNLRLGTSYLKLVLDDLDDLPVLASAAYNAGPSRSRQWRASLLRPVEGAIFAETIPFNETRDYVKKVMSNAVYYALLADEKPQSLKARLGVIAPKGAGVTELP